MTKVLVTRGSLEDTAGAIRAKLGVQTTYKPSQFAAAIGSISTHANLGTKTVTQNGTYTASSDNLDGYSQVTVNVSGGGGGGGGGGGSAPTFLSNSTQADILVNEYYTSYDDTNNEWGDLTVTGTPTLVVGGVRTQSGNGMSYQLSGDNVDVTVYAVFRDPALTNSTMLVLSIPYANSGGNAPNFNIQGGVIYESRHGNDISVGVGSRDTWHILTIAVDSTNNTEYFYVDGTSYGSMTYTNSGSKVMFNGSYEHSQYGGVLEYIYCGIVDGYESSSTILANQQEMLDFLHDARILTP